MSRNTEKDSKIISMFYAGISYKEIGKACGFSQGYVYTICKKLNLSRKAPRYYPDNGRIMETINGARQIAWSKQMIDDLCRMFPTNTNQDIADFLGVSVRTVVRKARKLGLRKDENWFHQIILSHAKEGHIIHRRLGYPGAIKPGEHRSPATEFKKKNVL